jgi:hypothetical protein
LREFGVEFDFDAVCNCLVDIVQSAQPTPGTMN